MFKRPYTGVLINDGSYEVIGVDASPERDQARKQIAEKYPDADLIALIPGEHYRHAWVFNEGRRSSLPKSDSYIDPYDTPMPMPEGAD